MKKILVKNLLIILLIVAFLASVPRMKEYLEELLQDIFEKAYPILVQ